MNNKPAYPDEGGFLLKFNGKDVKYCYKVSVDYDNWEYSVNADPPQEIPGEVKTITIEVEHP